MYTQLHELQRRQQLQQTGDAMNPNYVNQLSSLKQASPVQFTVNGNPIQDSPMFTVGDMQTLQSNSFQGFPNGVAHSQSENHALGHMGPSQPQFDVSFYGTPSPNIDKTLNLSSHLQEPTNHSSSFMSQHGNFSFDQINVANVFEENNMFGQVPIQSLNSDLLSMNYSEQGIRNAPILESSLDPLEQKFLYNTDENSWDSSITKNSKMGNGGFECTVENPSYMETLPTIQNGSWSTLMQSAVTETSSSDTVMQEEWSGLSFQNPEISNDNQPSNLSYSGNMQNNWVDLQPSPSSEPEQLFQKSNGSCFPGFQQSGDDHLKRKDEFMFDPSVNAWPAQYNENSENDGYQPNVNDKNAGINFSGHEMRDTLWLQGSTPKCVSGGTQKPFDQVNQLSVHRSSVKSEKITPNNNVELMSALFGASSGLHGQNVTPQSELPPTQTSVTSIAKPCNNVRPDLSAFGFRLGPADAEAPQSYSFFPSLGNSSATGLPAPWPNITNQQNVPSPNAHSLSSVSFQSPSSRAPNEQHNQNFFNHSQNVQEYGMYSRNSEIYNPTSLSTSTHAQESSRNHQSPRNAETGSDKRLPLNYQSINYQRAFANARELLLSGQKPLVKDYANNDQTIVQRSQFSPGNNKETFIQNFQQKETFGQNDTQSRRIRSNDASDVASQSQTSLQMAPSWFKHYGTLKNGRLIPMCNQNAEINAPQLFSGLSDGNLPENSLITQINSAKARQEGGVGQSPDVNVIMSKHLSPLNVLPSDGNNVNLAASKPKRKIVTFDVIPWHKEVNHEAVRPHNISVADLEWAQATNRKQGEAKIGAETVEDMPPVVRVKRRLIFTTQLVQQVFKPAPAVILFADASSNYDCVAYSTARLSLGDVCNLIRNLSSHSNDIMHKSPDELKTSNDFSKVTKGLISRVEKFEGDLSRLDRNLSLAAMKKESRELDKISIVNRFAKFHMKANPSIVESDPSTLQKTRIQRYVTPHPMPEAIPEVIDCLSL